jgi:uncharacterized membrane protein YedE/YeeE
MAGFTPLSGALGGALIGCSLALMLVATGRIAGLSGIIAGVLRGGDRAWRAWFLAAALAVGALWRVWAPGAFDAGVPAPLAVVAVAGVLVGIGTRAANGCTSGHGLCGVSRLSKRSIVATGVFMASGIATATLVGPLWR